MKLTLRLLFFPPLSGITLPPTTTCRCYGSWSLPRSSALTQRRLPCSRMAIRLSGLPTALIEALFSMDAEGAIFFCGLGTD